jgi:hypothetical protein
MPQAAKSRKTSLFSSLTSIEPPSGHLEAVTLI